MKVTKLNSVVNQCDKGDIVYYEQFVLFATIISKVACCRCGKEINCKINNHNGNFMQYIHYIIIWQVVVSAILWEILIDLLLDKF